MGAAMQAASTTFQLRREGIIPAADELAEAFRSASPFPHVVVDGMFPDQLLDDVLDEFPEPEAVPWQSFDSARELKLALADTEGMGPVTRNLLAELNGQVFIEYLEHLTGITGLVSDPHYLGGGLHQIRRTGYLKVHADFNRHERLKLDRRLNVLLYLNRDWPEEYGGHLELWDTDMAHCARKISPIFNRMVVFATTDFAYHGHPDPLRCPETRARRSLALYYYTNGRPASEVSSAHTTLFRARPGEEVTRPWREVVDRWIPPAVHDAVRRSRRRNGTRPGEGTPG
jgi:Rps23 Pro-64 3,4-dihydroxylase Tpa1-like proline 4-hydroxylase